MSLYSGAAVAVVDPKPLPGDARLGELIYDRDQVFQIQVAKGTATIIVLGPDERIVASAAGSPADCNRPDAEWCIVANTGTQELYVQPRTLLPTRNNLQLSTTLRRYSFEFFQTKSAHANPPWYRVSFRYEAPGAVRPASPDAPPAKGQACNWNYTMSASPAATRMAPLAVFDDGRDTYLMLPPGTPLPEVESDAGKEALRGAPGMAASQLLMLSGVRTSFTLRAGVAAVTVWNDSAAAAAAGTCPVW